MTSQIQPEPRRGGSSHASWLAQPARGSGTKNRIDVEFEAGPTAAAGARNALTALEGKVDARLLGDVRLLVSELVTNSVRHSDAHARDVVHMSVSVTETSLRVEVADPGKGFEPKPRDADRTRPGGWGLVLVDELSDRWGVARDQLTRVWFEMDHARSDGLAA
jgi:anti-sigma regulatory factor (Ser/Thr protein kinase)